MAAVNSPYQSASLYVGDLNPTVTEALLFEIFKAVGPVASIRVCRDAVTRRSLGYAYVNFHNVVDAERALDTLNYTLIKGRPCRIMWSHRDPSIRKSGQGNIFIKNLDKTIDNKALFDTFSAFGNILSCKVVTDAKGNSRGYGFVHYETREAAEGAISKVHGMLLNGKIVYVGPFVPRKERLPGSDPDKFTNVYIKNLGEAYTEEDLKRDFGAFGTVQSAVLMKDPRDPARQFAFVNYEDHESAQKATEGLNGRKLGDRDVYVGRAQKRSEREAFLRKLREERAQKYQGINLYIKNLDDSVNDEELRKLFSALPFGQITSCKVMSDDKGNSRGFGFVCYTNPEDAAKAVSEMNGKMIANKPIYVALAERKDVRSAKLATQHAARAAARVAGNPGLAGAPMAYPGFYAAAGPQAAGPQQRAAAAAAAAAQAGFVGYAPQGVPVPRRGPWTGAPQASAPGRQYQPIPGGYVMPGLPGVAQRQPHRQPRGPNGSAPQGAAGGLPQGPPVVVPAGAAAPMAAVGPNGAGGRNFKYTQNARNQQQAVSTQAPGGAAAQVNPAAAAAAGGGGGGIPPVTNVAAAVAAPASGKPSDIAAMVPLAMPSLASATPEERKNILGDSLYPLVESLTSPDQGPKITGMLLESMDVGELLHLLQSPDALREKVEEAVEVLKAHENENGEAVEN